MVLDANEREEGREGGAGMTAGKGEGGKENKWAGGRVNVK